MQSKTFRLFISSTFSDFNEERRLLQTHVFPKVKDYCSGKGYTFQPIDLRWGVSNEAQLDQKTLELCINEVHASKLQPHPNFLIMAGDRYGWVPCPYAIEEEEFKAIKKQVKATDEPLTIEYKEYKVKDSNACETGDKGSFDEQDDNKIFKPNDRQTTKIELLEKWYKLDENQIPPSYILQERVNNEHGCYESYQYWEAEENALREILQTAVELTNLDATPKEKYFDSATEQEVLNGIVKYKDKPTPQQDELINKNKDYESLDESHVYGYIRNIKTVEGKKPKADTEFFDKEDLQPRISDFKQQLRDSIKNDNLLEVNADLTNFNKDEKNKSLNYEYDSIGTKSDEDSEKDSKFVKGMIAYLKQSVDKFDKHIASIGLDEPEAIEIESQRVFKEDKAKGFVGREDDLEAIQSYIESDNNQALVIYGPSGMGKSALMAKAIEQTEDKHKDKQKILYRFVASTASLSTSIEVVISMLKELGVEESIQTTKDDSEQDKPEELQEFFARVSGHLSSLTEQTTIFIDAVDQFTNKDALEDGYEFIWLPKQLPDNLKIVISALEDDKYPEDSKYLELLKTKISNQDNLHKLEPFSGEHAKEMINGILSQYKRSITPEQQNYLFAQPDSNKPLYLSIATQELKHWKSTDTTKAYQIEGQGQDLAPTQREIIDEYIQNLTELYHHDQELVHRVVSYLHLTDGLSESELLEILSTDEGFIDHIAPDTYHNKTEKTLPVVIWARLHTQLKPFLKLEKKDGQETMGFFHREFDSAIKEQEHIQQTHENLIKLVLELMQKYQDHPFDSNRYGKLYIELIAEHYRRYKDQVALEQYGKDIATIKNEDFLKAINSKLSQIGEDLRKIAQHPEAIIYLTPKLFCTEVFYQIDPSVWALDYIRSLNNLAASYQSNNQIDEAIDLQKQALEITKPLYQENPSVWALDYIRSLNNLAVFYQSNNQIDEAIDLQKQALEITKPLYQENPSVWALDYTTSLNNLALSYQNNNQIDEAIDLQKQALEIREPLYQENPSVWALEYFRSLNNLAASYQSNNQIDEAIDLQKQVLEITKPLYQENPSVRALDYIRSLNNLAASYQSNNQIDEAIDLQKQALEITKPLYQENPSVWALDYFRSLNNLAASYQSNNQIDEAIDLQKQALEITKPLYQENPSVWALDYIRSLNNLAASYQSNNQIDEAIDLQKQALEITKPLYQENPSVWAEGYIKSLNNLAVFYQSNNQIDEAIDLQKQALEITKPLYQENPSVWALDYFTSLNNLARSYQSNNQIDEAIDLQKQALEIIKPLYQENPSVWAEGYIKSLNNLAVFYQSNNQIDEAIDLQKQALEITKPLYQENPSVWALDYFTSLNNLAVFYQSNNQIDEAISLQEKALEIREALYQENPSVWAEDHTTSLNNLARSYQNNQTDQAISLEEKALEITEALYQENPSVWAKKYTGSLNNLARSYANNNQTDQAISLQEKALEIREALYQENPSVWTAKKYTRSLNNLARSYANNNQTDQAISLEEKALEITKPLYQENPSVWAEDHTRSLNNLARSYQYNNQTDQAISLSVWALDYTTSLNNLAYFYKHNNQTDQAISLEEKALEITKPLYQENPSVWAKKYTTSLNNLAMFYSEIQDGPQQFWHESGQKKAEINYKDGKQEGLETWWHENGQKQSEYNYKDDKKEGLETQWHESGQKKAEINYKNGKQEGLTKLWHDDKAEINYKDGKQEGLETWWHENGQKQSEYNYKDDKKEGLETQWHESGQKKAEINYKNGKQEGLETWWHENGQKQSEYNYKDDKKEGLETQWHESGQKKAEINYKNGKQEGLTKLWHDDGSKYVEVNLKNGERHGARTFWDKDGNVTFSGTYNNGESNDQNGLEPQYDDEGDLTHYIEYKDGVVVNEKVEKE